MSKNKKNKNNAPRVPFRGALFKPTIGTAKTVENMQRWVKSLNPIEIDFIQMYAKELYAPVINNFDCCITATLLQEFEDMSFQEVCIFQDKMIEMLNEHVEVDKSLKIKGVDIMANKDKLEPKVVQEVEKILGEGKLNQKQSIEHLKMKFPTLSIASLTNCYKKVKELNKSKMEVTEERAKAEEKVVTIANKEEIKAAETEREKDIKEISKKVDTLKIVSKQIVVEGMFGQYTKTETGVTFKNEYWTSVKEVKEKTEEVVEELKKQIESLEQKIDYITAVSLEIEQVFNM